MRYVLHKDKDKLTKEESWYLERYTSMSSELKEAYEKMNFIKRGNGIQWKKRILRWKEETKNSAFLKAIKTFKNWQI